MEKVMCSYETLFVVRPDLSEEDTAAVVNKFTTLITDNGGVVENVNAWGKRRLAYPIEKFVEGYYVLVNFKSEATLPAELKRVFGISDEILRNIVVHSCGVAPAAEEKAPEAAPAVAAAEETPAEETAAE